MLSSCPAFCFCLVRRPPGFGLFPYTTLFRSQGGPALRAVLDGEQTVESVRARLVLGDFCREAKHQLSVADEFEDQIGRAHVELSHLGISYAVFCLKKKKK